MKEFNRIVESQLREAASEVDFLPTPSVSDEQKIDEIPDLFVQFLDKMKEDARFVGDQERINIYRQVSPQICHGLIGILPYASDIDFMPTLEERFGISVNPTEDGVGASVSISIHKSVWTDFTTNERHEDLAEHIWNILPVLDIQCKLMNKQGSLIPFNKMYTSDK